MRGCVNACGNCSRAIVRLATERAGAVDQRRTRRPRAANCSASCKAVADSARSACGVNSERSASAVSSAAWKVSPAPTVSMTSTATEAGAIYVMDRGYLDFARLYTLHQTGAFFVTITLDGFYSQCDYPEHLRRIRFKAPITGKRLTFLTNATALDAITICHLYKVRWQVELFFKWIKQHLRIRQDGFVSTGGPSPATSVWMCTETASTSPWPAATARCGTSAASAVTRLNAWAPPEPAHSSGRAVRAPAPATAP